MNKRLNYVVLIQRFKHWKKKINLELQFTFLCSDPPSWPLNKNHHNIVTSSTNLFIFLIKFLIFLSKCSRIRNHFSIFMIQLALLFLFLYILYLYFNRRLHHTFTLWHRFTKFLYLFSIYFWRCCNVISLSGSNTRKKTTPLTLQWNKISVD